MVRQSPGSNAFEFVRLASLRTAQLIQGSVARVPKSHRSILTAQLEVAAGMIQAVPRPDVYGSAPPARINGQLDAVPPVRR
jgi:hypothetical protein